ncbi:MAG: hypothetical protein WAT93_09725 [Pontixanthobacter sp.]
MTAPIDHLRHQILADDDLQSRLHGVDETGQFLDEVLAIASEMGLHCPRSELQSLLSFETDNPLAANPGALALNNSPPDQWLPVSVVLREGQLHIEWVSFAAIKLTAPFFEQSMRLACHQPFNRLMRCITPLSALEEFAGSPAPDGFIFHMSRCGSTLVAQMLAANPDHVVLSEAPLIDTIVQMANRGIISAEVIPQTIGALLRGGTGLNRRRFLKLDSWHTLSLPLFRQLFPETPWIFLYREPIEVLVSHQRKPGMHVIPGVIRLDSFGVHGAEQVAAEDYPAWVLTQICNAALLETKDSKGMFVNYCALPDAFGNSILPHFHMKPTDAELTVMVAAAQNYSKVPDQKFESDSAEKQQAAGVFLKSTAAAQLVKIFDTLEHHRLRAFQPILAQTSVQAAKHSPSVTFTW